jgi:hypothetical protein
MEILSPTELRQKPHSVKLQTGGLRSTPARQKNSGCEPPWVCRRLQLLNRMEP